MSKQKHIIEIEPTEYNCQQEKMFFSGFRCPKCGGKGGFTENIGWDEYKTTSCTFCDGTGKIMGEVLINWLPDYGC